MAGQSALTQATAGDYLPAMDQVANPAADTSADAALATDACVLRHVARASRAVVAAYDPALAPHGLTGHQYNLMMTLRNAGPLTVGSLASILGMDASGVPRAIKPLTESGLVDVQRGTDRRQRVLSLTRAGKAAVDTAEPAWLRVQTELVDKVGGERWLQLIADLRSVRRAATACSTRAG